METDLTVGLNDLCRRCGVAARVARRVDITRDPVEVEYAACTLSQSCSCGRQLAIAWPPHADHERCPRCCSRCVDGTVSHILYSRWPKSALDVMCRKVSKFTMFYMELRWTYAHKMISIPWLKFFDSLIAAEAPSTCGPSSDLVVFPDWEARTHHALLLEDTPAMMVFDLVCTRNVHWDAAHASQLRSSASRGTKASLVVDVPQFLNAMPFHKWLNWWLSKGARQRLRFSCRRRAWLTGTCEPPGPSRIPGTTMQMGPACNVTPG